MKNEDLYIGTFDEKLKQLFQGAFKLSLKDPGKALFFLRTLLKQRSARRRREKLEREGTHVPPFMIFSITKQCNLKCSGCYMREHG